MTQEEQWGAAKFEFEHENYLTAIDLLTSYTLNYSGSPKIDSAQFLLGECHFALNEYILAESEYNRLLQNMAQSPLAPEAQLKIVLCNAYLSPGPGLDQSFTEKAIGGAQNYKEDYPDADITLRLARRGNAWQTLGKIFTFGLYKPRQRDVKELPIFDTKVVYPHYSISFGQWLLKMVTFGVHKPHSRLVIPKSKEVKGDWVVDRALQDSRARLAQKDYKAGELYFRQEKYPSAVIYFDRVLDLYSDTPWSRPSLQLKGDALFTMKKYQEAAGAYGKYLSLYGDDTFHMISKRLRESQKHPTIAVKPDTSGIQSDSLEQATKP